MPRVILDFVAPYTPEFLPVAQFAIEGMLAGGGDVFEYGSGHSTLWFAQFANVVTVEDDEGWYMRVKKALEKEGLTADQHIVPEAEMPGVIDQYDTFDLVLVDCWDYQRVPAVKAAMPHVKVGGWLVLDDSHWPLLAPAKEMLNTWPYTEMRGPHLRKTGLLRGHQTRIYERPA